VFPLGAPGNRSGDEIASTGGPILPPLATQLVLLRDQFGGLAAVVSILVEVE